MGSEPYTEDHMEIDVNKLLEVSKELALHKHVLEMDLANAKHEANVKLTHVLAHAQQALDEVDDDWSVVRARLEDIVKLVKGE